MGPATIEEVRDTLQHPNRHQRDNTDHPSHHCIAIVTGWSELPPEQGAKLSGVKGAAEPDLHVRMHLIIHISFTWYTLIHLIKSNVSPYWQENHNWRLDLWICKGSSTQPLTRLTLRHQTKTQTQLWTLFLNWSLAVVYIKTMRYLFILWSFQWSWWSPFMITIISIIIVFVHVNLTCSSFGEGVPYEGRKDKARVKTVSLKSEQNCWKM